jgi:carboxypeptidase C (cathepsin A)
VCLFNKSFLQVYYVLATNPDPYPPNITDYLNTIRSKVGAATTWQETSDDVYYRFAATGDWMRTSKAYLENVVNSGVRTLIFDGDADYILNFNGVEAMVPSPVQFMASPIPDVFFTRSTA